MVALQISMCWNRWALAINCIVLWCIWTPYKQVLRRGLEQILDELYPELNSPRILIPPQTVTVITTAPCCQTHHRYHRCLSINVSVSELQYPSPLISIHDSFRLTLLDTKYDMISCTAFQTVGDATLALMEWLSADAWLCIPSWIIKLTS